MMVGERLRLLGAIRLLGRQSSTALPRALSLSPKQMAHPIPSPTTPLYLRNILPTNSTSTCTSTSSGSVSQSYAPISPPARTASPVQVPSLAPTRSVRPSSADTMQNNEAPTPAVQNQPLRRPNTASGAGSTLTAARPVNNSRSPSASSKQLETATPLSSQSQLSGYTVGRGGFGSKPRTNQISAPYNLRRTETEAEDSGRPDAHLPSTPVQSLEVIRKHIIKFLAEDGTSRSVDVSQCKQASDVLAKVLRKFGRLTEPDSTKYLRRWVLAMTDADGQLKVLSEIELMAVCSQPHNYDPVWQRGLYLLRTTDEVPLRPGSKREAPVDAFQHMPMTRRASTFRILNGLGGGELSAEEPVPSDPAVRSKAKLAEGLGPLPAVRRRVRNFFRQRPSSELISSHLAEYFPATDSTELHRHSNMPAKDRGPVPMTPYAPRAEPVEPKETSAAPNDDNDNTSLLTVDAITLDLEERESVTDSHDDNVSEGSDHAAAAVETAVPMTVVRGSSTASVTPSIVTPIASPEHALAPLADGSLVPSIVSPTKQRMRWHKGALIGTGSFGKVFLGMNAKTGMLMAVKQVELPQSNDEMTRHRRMMIESLESEIELLKSIEHPNIVQYLDSFADEQHLNIFLEYVPGGSVVALLQSYGAFEEALVQNFVRQILRGLSFLHARNIVHRDIKGANILVDNKGGVKISDFGISKKVESGLLFAGTNVGKSRPAIQGSVYWMAPEVVKQTAFTAKADVWSLGCCVVEMFTATHPWPQLDQMQALFQIGLNRSPALPADISPMASSFLRATFELNHADRPSADVLLHHAFVLQATDEGEMDASEPM